MKCRQKQLLPTFQTATFPAKVVDGNGVVFLKCRLEMLEVGFARELDAKVVNDKTERDRSPHMAPEAGCVLALVVTLHGEPSLEKLIREDTGLGKAVHTLVNRDVDPPVGCDDVA